MSNPRGIQEAIQTGIRSLSRFENEAVVLDEWSILDGSFDWAPWVQIHAPGLIGNTYNSMDCAITRWSVRAEIIRPFVNWPDTRAALIADRTAILNYYNTADNRNLISGSYTSIEIIRDETAEEPTTALWRKDGGQQIDETSEPTWLTLPMIFTVEERTD